MEPLSRIPKNRQNKVLETIRITREEYNDFCRMRDFIYDNNMVILFETYCDVVLQMKQNELDDENT